MFKLQHNYKIIFDELFKTQHTKVENLQRFHQNSSNIIQDFSTDKKEIKFELNWQLKSHWNIV